MLLAVVLLFWLLRRLLSPSWNLDPTEAAAECWGNRGIVLGVGGMMVGMFGKGKDWLHEGVCSD